MVNTSKKSAARMGAASFVVCLLWDAAYTKHAAYKLQIHRNIQ